MLLYLDDDFIHGIVVVLLRKAGHDVVLPADVGLSGADDSVHLTHAIRKGRPLFSFNHDDFEQLHTLIETAGGHHPGILIVRRDNDKRDLKPHGIVKALAKLLATGDPIPDHFTILNQYR
jgi:Domain of unknown function (DUF5615)